MHKHIHLLTSLLLLFLSSCLSSPTYAAGPVTHIYLADQWLQSGASVHAQERSLFLLGTSFPDIRYIVKIDRETTHRVNVTLDQINHAKDAFEAGFLFHSYVDEQREAMVMEWGIYDHLQEVAHAQHLASLLKYIEDDILYHRIDLLYAISCFNQVPEEEKQYGVDLKDLQRWHLFLTLYLGMCPGDAIKYLAAMNKPMLRVPPETVQLWNTHFDELRNKPELQAYVDNLIKGFALRFVDYAAANGVVANAPLSH